jgi:hypothetical protein
MNRSTARSVLTLATGCLATTLAFAVCPETARAAQHSIVVSAPDHDYPEAPVSVSVPAPGQFKAVTLRQLRPEASVLCQYEKRGGELVVTWILRDLKKGSSRTYELTIGDGPQAAATGGLTLKEGDDAVEVRIDDELFTRYYHHGAPKPVLWPIIGPTGKSVTRNYPMTDALETERDDHHHHRGLWQTHGNINGTDFWSEGGNSGRALHREFVELAGGPVYATIKTRNDWVAGQWERIEPKVVDGVRLHGWKPVGEPTRLCADEREIRIYRMPTGRIIDYTTTIRATDGELVFGDTKEGSFGIRLAGTMKVDSEPGGHVVNSNGQTDKEAWGKSAAWCDYYGPVEGTTVGVTIMDHPTSFRHPTYWHVRTYGLFAANPFGLHHFLRQDEHTGIHRLPPGETVTFKYRVFIHEGDTEAAGVADAYVAYADPPRIEVK